MREADQRAKVILRIENVARANALNARQNLLFKCGFAFRRNEDAGAVGTHLTGAEEVRHHGDISGEIEICIVENDQRRFTAQLHGHFFQGGSCRVSHHFFAAGDTAGK